MALLVYQISNTVENIRSKCFSLVIDVMQNNKIFVSFFQSLAEVQIDWLMYITWYLYWDGKDKHTTIHYGWNWSGDFQYRTKIKD